MRRLVQWAVHNSPSMNTLVIAILIVGMGSAYMLRREQFPEFKLDMVTVSVAYPGASPEEVEQGVCQKIEEAVRSVDGIRKVLSVSREGFGVVQAELETRTDDLQRVVNDVRSAVDRIPSLPELAEEPEISTPTTRDPVLQLSVVGPDGNDPTLKWKLREIAERVYDDLLELPGISQVTLLGAPAYQIDVEISEATLRKHDLTLKDVATAIRRENVEIPAGRMRTKSSEILLRGTNRRVQAEEISLFPVLTDSEGLVLNVGDLGRVVDGFEDSDSASYIDGRMAISLQIDKTSTEDVMEISDQVQEYIAGQPLPSGYDLVIWFDTSSDVRGRLLTVTRGGVFGLILVFLALSMFLDIRLAFWVALGIPVSVFGACAVMFYNGATLNQLSTFSFVMALGIVVDDAIVIGENIYSHRQRGKSRVAAAVDGTIEVAGSVIASVLSTIIAFTPMFFVSGIMGKFIAIMPLVIISMLVVSLFESLFILPCHLAHTQIRPKRGLYLRMRSVVDRGIETTIYRFYRPLLGWLLARPHITFTASASILLVTLGLIQGGFTPFVMAPDFDGDIVVSEVGFPMGTPASVTHAATLQIEQAIRKVAAEYSVDGRPLLRLVHRNIGASAFSDNPGRAGSANRGVVYAEFLSVVEGREITSERLIKLWRDRVDEIAGSTYLLFEGAGMGIGGRPIEFKLLGNDIAELDVVVAQTKKRLESYPGVHDVRDGDDSGRWEVQLKIKDRAESLGVTLEDLASTVRGAYYGEEVMRLQRGRHEVKLMVRYPKAERRSMEQFEEIRVRTPAGDEIPLPELAHREVHRTRNKIVRLDQSRAITITAGVDDRVANVQDVVSDLTTDFFPALFEQHSGIRVRWEGDQEESLASLRSLFIGFAIAMFGIFLLLTVQFRSYLQPLLVLAVIPFGIVGAIWGHLIMGLPLTIFTMFGLVALSGVVVNDSIVLIDFINRRRAEGLDLHEALMAAGCQRFRPVLLTSVTTVAGLVPILVERSIQAEILIPMAVSLAFGLSLATVWVLMLIPSLYRFYALHLERRKTTDREQQATPVSTQSRQSEAPTEPAPVMALD